MRSLVNLEVFTAGEHLAAAREGAREGFLSCVHADVVDEFIFGFEGFAVPVAVLPVARVVSHLRSSDMLHCDVRDDFVHGVEEFAAHCCCC